VASSLTNYTQRNRDRGRGKRYRCDLSSICSLAAVTQMTIKPLRTIRVPFGRSVAKSRWTSTRRIRDFQIVRALAFPDSPRFRDEIANPAVDSPCARCTRAILSRDTSRIAAIRPLSHCPARTPVAGTFGATCCFHSANGRASGSIGAGSRGNDTRRNRWLNVHSGHRAVPD